MRIGGRRNFNCTLSAPGYGSFRVVATALGYGLSVAMQTPGVSRTQRTFYPFARTSGPWYVETAHGSLEERDELSRWLLVYTKRVSSPWVNAPQPMTLTVPSRNYVKVGYPIGAIDFGDEAMSSSWNMVVSFASASDPTSSALDASRYIPASGATGTMPGDSNLSSDYVAPEIPSTVTVPPDSGIDQDRWGTIPGFTSPVVGSPVASSPSTKNPSSGTGMV